MDMIAKIDWLHLLYAIGLVVFGYIISKRVGVFVEHAVGKRYSKHGAMLAYRLVFYALFLIFVVSALQQLGFKMTVLLGAAGVFTVALSFASQTAASNLVSGIFLIFERPFKVGDLVEVKQIKGTVESIDLLSTKIKTADNTLIRVPNEAIMKSEIINASYFKTRRVDILVKLDFTTDFDLVRQLLLEVAMACDRVLKQPEPSVIIDGFSEDALNLRLQVWAKTSTATSLKNELYQRINQRFNQEKITIASSPLDKRR